ncbi:MAG TPA: MlaD family protein [Mucilaginibacter sp.]|jgi:phospholipid/cholesterol/gamma-HCH transport system substrate-binding protein
MATIENRKAITVGIFLALAIVIFVLGVFTLGGQQKSFQKNIHVSAVFDDVSGLKKGNDVWFSGVKIGTISTIKFVGTSEVNVSMKIDENTQQYIHRNAGVRISSDGLIGNKIIVIDGGSPRAPQIEDGDVLQAEKVVSTDDVMKTLQQNNQNILAITTDFKLLSHKILQGKGTVGALMADSTMGIQLRNSMRNLQIATESASRLAVQLDRFGQKVNTKGGLADKLFTDTTTFNKIKAVTIQLQQAANNANALTENLSKASHKFNTTDNTLGELLNDPKGAEQIKSILTNLQQSSVKLNEDLQAAQHNFLLKGYFKDQEKAKADSIKKSQKQ